MHAPAVGSARLRSFSDLPGPRGLPLVGIAPRIVTERFHLQLEQWYRRYRGTYAVKLGPQRVIVFGDTQSLRTVLKERPATFRRSSHMVGIVEELGASGLFTAESTRWRKTRRFTMPGFNQGQLRRFFPTLLTITDRLQRAWHRQADRSGTWDFRGDFERFTTDVTTALAFGHDLNTVEGGRDLFQDDIELVFHAVARRLAAPFPLWRYVKLPRERRAEAARDRLRATLETLIDATRETLLSTPGGADPDNAETLLEAMLAAQLADDDEPGWSNDEIYGNVMTLLLAGEDTTAHTLAWIACTLAAEPAVQRRLQRELDRELGDAPGIRDMSEMERLPYLSGVLQEALRLRGVAPILFFEALEDTAVGGVGIAKGEALVLLTRHCAAQDANFSRAAEFLPERWQRDNEAARRCPVHETKAMMPFGAGPRICPGRGLSLLEMSVGISHLFRNFDVESRSGFRRAKERFVFTMAPHGVELRLRRRRGTSR